MGESFPYNYEMFSLLEVTFPNHVNPVSFQVGLVEGVARFT